MIARSKALLTLPSNRKQAQWLWITLAAVVFALLATSTPMQNADARSAAGYVKAEFKKSPTPTIVGLPTVGSYLTVVPGTWDSGVALSIQWQRNFVDIKGQTKSRYLLTRADLGRQISVTVTGVKKGFVTHVSGSPQVLVLAAGVAPSPSPNPSVSPSPAPKPTPTPSPSPNPVSGKLTNTPTPTISGTATVGYELLAVPGNWDSGVQLSYQWFRASNPILGATGSKYVVSSDDSGFTLKVAVTGTKANFASVEKTSTSTKVVTASSTTLLDIAQSTKPLVRGSAQVGQSLSLVSGTWSNGVSLAIQWLRSGQPIQGASSTIYKLSPQDLNCQISVSVTGSMVGYKSLTIVSDATGSVTPGFFAEIGTPTVSGAASVGSSLTLTPGVWDKTAQLSFTWQVDGAPIAGETGLTYILRPSDAGKTVSATVTATAVGYQTETKSVSASGTVALGVINPAPTPTISGSNNVGSVLTANPGVWLQGVSLSYQWKKDGTSIAGATNSTYTIQVGDIGAVISVAVTGSKTGFQSLTKSANYTGQIPLSTLPSTPAPRVILLTGRTYSIDPATDWGAGVQFAYQWLRNNVEIANATSSTYIATELDSGQSLTLRVTGSKAGFAAVTSTSQPVAVPYLNFSKYNMNITFPIEVGATVDAAPDFDPGTTFAYQWTRDGLPIAGETQSSYLIKLTDAGHSIGFSFTASKPGYNTKTGSVSEKPVPLVLVLAPTPTITGDTKYFSKLTANPGVWDAGVTLTYDWYSLVTLPTASNPPRSFWLNDDTPSYTGVQTANGRYFYVCVTGKKGNLKPVQKCSDYFGPMQNNVFPNQPKPRIVGTPAAGSTLSVDVSGWLSGATFSYSWYFTGDGMKTSGGSNSTYLLSTSQFLYQTRKVQVRIDVTKDGYDTVTLYSDELSF